MVGVYGADVFIAVRSVILTGLRMKYEDEVIQGLAGLEYAVAMTCGD